MECRPPLQTGGGVRAMGACECVYTYVCVCTCVCARVCAFGCVHVGGCGCVTFSNLQAYSTHLAQSLDMITVCSTH